VAGALRFFDRPFAKYSRYRTSESRRLGNLSEREKNFRALLIVVPANSNQDFETPATYGDQAFYAGAGSAGCLGNGGALGTVHTPVAHAPSMCGIIDGQTKNGCAKGGRDSFRYFNHGDRLIWDTISAASHKYDQGDYGGQPQAAIAMESPFHVTACVLLRQ
jgi:hypothetical protein